MRTHLLVEALEARGQVHRVADDRIFLAALRADSSGDRLTDMDADAEADRPGMADIARLDAHEHLTRGGDGVRGLERIVDRRAENGEQAVAEELVHNAVVPIDDFDQNLEHVVKALDDLGRRSGARRRGEAADVDEHHANATHLAEFGRADREQPLDHARRDVLTEEVGHFVAGRRRGERASEMALDRRARIASQQARCEKDGAARRMIADAEVRILGLPAKMQRDESEHEELDRGDCAGERREAQNRASGSRE